MPPKKIKLTQDGSRTSWKVWTFHYDDYHPRALGDQHICLLVWLLLQMLFSAKFFILSSSYSGDIFWPSTLRGVIWPNGAVEEHLTYVLCEEDFWFNNRHRTKRSIDTNDFDWVWFGFVKKNSANNGTWNVVLHNVDEKFFGNKDVLKISR